MSSKRSIPSPAPQGEGHDGAGGSGGGIFNLGSLVVTNSTFSTNVISGGSSGNASEQAPGLGGGNALGAGIFNGGRLAVGYGESLIDFKAELDASPKTSREP